MPAAVDLSARHAAWSRFAAAYERVDDLVKQRRTLQLHRISGSRRVQLDQELIAAWSDLREAWREYSLLAGDPWPSDHP